MDDAFDEKPSSLHPFPFITAYHTLSFLCQVFQAPLTLQGLCNLGSPTTPALSVR